MIAALLSLLTVWVTPAGLEIRVAHCRAQPAGCEAFVAEVVHHAQAAADAWDIPPALLLAVGFVESGLDPNLEGKAGELGIWQGHPAGSGARARRYQRESGLPAQYTRAFCAAEELRRGLDACGTVDGALRYYNAGHCGSAGRYGRKVRTVQTALEAATNG